LKANSIDGKEFDSSAIGGSSSFPMKGWAEALTASGGLRAQKPGRVRSKGLSRLALPMPASNVFSKHISNRRIHAGGGVVYVGENIIDMVVPVLHGLVERKRQSSTHLCAELNAAA
jgi:hypothetical protein